MPDALSIAVIAGDGIGPEIMPSAVAAVDRCAAHWGFGVDWTDYDWGSARYRSTGAMMPADGIDQLRRHDAILFGAVGAPDIPDTETLWGLLIPSGAASTSTSTCARYATSSAYRRRWPIRTGSTSWSSARTSRANTPTSATGVSTTRASTRSRRRDSPGRAPRASRSSRRHWRRLDPASWSRRRSPTASCTRCRSGRRRCRRRRPARRRPTAVRAHRRARGCRRAPAPGFRRHRRVESLR